ncbi:MAG: tetratricopeptide repeat protein [Terracidiphilus sp.]
MRSRKQRRQLSVFSLCVTLATGTWAAAAQSPAPPSIPSPVPSNTAPSGPAPTGPAPTNIAPSGVVISTPPLAENAPSPSVHAVQVFQPTPEQSADALLAQKRYQAAVEAYKKIPDPSADVWNKMGISYQMLFNLEDASRCYERSLKMNPKNARVLNNLASVYDAQKDLTAAERLYHRALRYEPKSAMILRNLGTNLLAQHKYKKGWEDYQAALAIDPDVFGENVGPRIDNPASIQERGAMNYFMAKGCVRAGQNDRAIEYLRMALNEGYTNPKKIQADSEFAVLHGNPAFEELLAAQSAPKPAGKL